MRQLSTSGQQAVNDIAQRHGFSVEATSSMLEAVINGNGGMAQFNHPEFAGYGQWMRGGMTMVSDMFNNHLKGRVDALCAELSNLVASQPDLIRTGSFQSQSQNGGFGFGQVQAQTGYGSHPGDPFDQGAGQQQGLSGFGSASLFVPPAPGSSGDWWPADLRWPNSTGAQNGVRYAYFAQARRLAIDVGGTVTVYDTLDHQIGGFSQQQSVGGTLSFSSQYGLIDVGSLPVVSIDGETVPFASRSTVGSGQGAQPTGAFSSGIGQGSEQDVFATIEKLAGLHAKGVLSEDEFLAKKAELLARL